MIQDDQSPAPSPAEAVNSSPTQVANDQPSSRWEIQIPIITAAVPAFAFRLLGHLTPQLAKPGGDAPDGIVSAMIGLEVFGIIAMAVVMLIRFDMASKRLSDLAGGAPSAWRKMTLVLAMAMLLVFYTTVNLGAAFVGARILLVLGVPAFLAYLALCRLALVGLGNVRRIADRSW